MNRKQRFYWNVSIVHQQTTCMSRCSGLERKGKAGCLPVGMPLGEIPIWDGNCCICCAEVKNHIQETYRSWPYVSCLLLNSEMKLCWCCADPCWIKCQDTWSYPQSPPFKVSGWTARSLPMHLERWQRHIYQTSTHYVMREEQVVAEAVVKDREAHLLQAMRRTKSPKTRSCSRLIRTPVFPD